MPSTPAWWGWLWTGGRWERVASGHSLATCGKKLAREARRRGIPDKFSVLTGGGTPGYTPSQERGTR
jgi:hypothetical protein